MADVLSLDIEADGSDATRTLRQGAREVRDYQEELERLRIEAERTTRTTEDLRRSTDRANGTYKDASGRLRDTNGKFVAGGKGAESLAAGVFKADLAMKALGVAADVVNRTIDVTIEGFERSVRSAADLEAEITRVAAVTQNGTQFFDSLKTAAVDAGSASAFSAKEAGEGLRFLALAGFDANQQIGALPSVLRLATAGQLELADASDLSTNILSSYRFEVSELARVNDVLAKSSTNANVTVDQIGKTFEYVGPVAKAANQDFNGLIASIAQLGNVGIRADKAGTTLRQALVNLQAPTPKAARELKRLGVQVLDTNGQMRELVDILDDLDRAGIDSKGVNAIFGKIAQSGIQSLLDVGADELRRFTEELDNAGGTAEDIESRILSTFSGRLQILNGQLSTLSASVGDRFVPAGTEMLQILIDTTNEAIKNEAALNRLDAVAIDLVVVSGELLRVGADIVPVLALVVGLTIELGKGATLAADGVAELFDVTTNFIPVVGQLYDIYQLYNDALDENTKLGKFFKDELTGVRDVLVDIEARVGLASESLDVGTSLSALDDLGQASRASLLSAADGADKLAQNLELGGRGYVLFNDYAFKAIDAGIEFKNNLAEQVEAGEGYLGFLKDANAQLKDFGQNLLIDFGLSAISFSEEEVRAFNKQKNEEERIQRQLEEQQKRAAEEEAKRVAKLVKRNNLAVAELAVEKELDDLRRIDLMLELEKTKINQEKLTDKERELRLFQAQKKANEEAIRVIEEQQRRERDAALASLDARQRLLALTDELGALELNRQRQVLALEGQSLEAETLKTKEATIQLEFERERQAIIRRRQQEELSTTAAIRTLERETLGALATDEQRIQALRAEGAARIAQIQASEQDEAIRTLEIRKATQETEREILDIRLAGLQRTTDAVRAGLGAETTLIDASFSRQSQELDAQIQRLEAARQNVEAQNGDTTFLDRRIASLEAEAEGERRVQELLAQRITLLESVGGATLDLVDAARTLEAVQAGSAEAQNAQLSAISAAASLGSSIAAAAIRDTKKLALIQALFEGAASVAAFAAYAKSGFLAQNFLVASIQHAAAAAKFGIVAGTAAGAGGGAGGAGSSSSAAVAQSTRADGSGGQADLVESFTRALKDVFDRPVQQIYQVDFTNATLLESAPRIERRIRDASDRARRQTLQSLVG